MNRSQKVTIGFLFATLVLLISMHNPISGYAYEGPFYKVDLPLSPCADQDKKMYRQFLSGLYSDEATRDKLIISNGDPNQVEKIVTRQVDACHLLAPGIPTDGSTRPDFRKDQLDFSEWRSVDPLISWFGKIVNLFGALLSVVLIGVCFLYFIFPTTNEK